MSITGTCESLIIAAADSHDDDGEHFTEISRSTANCQRIDTYHLDAMTHIDRCDVMSFYNKPQMSVFLFVSYKRHFNKHFCSTCMNTC